MSSASILLHGREFHLSPLTLGDLRKLEAALLGVEQRVEHGFGPMFGLIPVIHASVSKLHPELAIEELEQMLDLHNFPHALERVLEVSGLKRQPVGEAGPAATPVESPTGHNSSATL